MSLLSYDQLHSLRYGNLLLRRWGKRWPLFLISINIWVDGLINSFIERGKSALVQASEGVNSIKEAEWQGIDVGGIIQEWVIDLDLLNRGILETVRVVDLIVLILLVVTVFFWIKIVNSLLFLFADYQCALRDGERRQYFFIVVLIINMVVYFLLESQGLNDF